jgi:hypothetical protein
MTSRLLRVAVGCVMAATCLSAQAKPAFEVAAIKRNVSGEPEGRLAMQTGGHFRATNFDVRNLIAFAYRTERRNLFPSQIIGAPGWLATERYDIVANIGAELIARGPSDPFQTPKLVQAPVSDSRQSFVPGGCHATLDFEERLSLWTSKNAAATDGIPADPTGQFPRHGRDTTTVSRPLGHLSAAVSEQI